MDLQENDFKSFKWLDITNPSKEVLEQLAVEMRLPKKVLLNCLDSDYLPHVETYGTPQLPVYFIVLRFMEPVVPMKADSVQELTTKIAFFVTAQRVVSIHRQVLREVAEVDRKLKTSVPTQGLQEEITRFHVLSRFFEQASLGFDPHLTELEKKMEEFEDRLFQNRKSKSTMLEGYYIKRKASASKKVTKLTVDALNKVTATADCPIGLMQQTKDRLERNLFYSEDVYDNMQSLLNLHMSVEAQRTNEASYRTNEIMRVLTVLSIFFLPLNFLAGVFGMNFERMPLLKNPDGFWESILAMLVISLGLMWYVLKKGWLKDRPQLNPTDISKDKEAL